MLCKRYFPPHRGHGGHEILGLNSWGGSIRSVGLANWGKWGTVCYLGHNLQNQLPLGGGQGWLPGDVKQRTPTDEGRVSWKARDHLKSHVVEEWIEGREKITRRKGSTIENHIKDSAGLGGKNLECFFKHLCTREWRFYSEAGEPACSGAA